MQQSNHARVTLSSVLVLLGHRFTLPALRFNIMDWPRRQHRRPGQRNRNDRDNDNNGDETQEGGKDARGRGKTLIPKTHLHTLSEFPKQFVLSSRREDGIPEDLHRSFSDSDAVDWLQDVTRDPEELQRLDREVQSFTDMDYVLPSHLDQLLRQEGVDEHVVDTTVALEKVWHDRAAYLNRIYHIKRRYITHIYHLKHRLQLSHQTQGHQPRQTQTTSTTSTTDHIYHIKRRYISDVYHIKRRYTQLPLPQQRQVDHAHLPHQTQVHQSLLPHQIQTTCTT